MVIGVSVADDDFSAHAWLQSHEVPAGWSELRDLEPDPARPRLRGVVGVAELSEETTVVLTPDERYLVLTGLSSVVFDQLVRGEAHERIRDFLIDRYRIDSARAAADLVAVESDLQRAGVLITS